METLFTIVPISDALKWPEDSDHHRPLVLVVDEEPVKVYALAAILDRSGFAVLTAHSRFEALEIAALIPPELLITDMSMCDVDGLDGLGLAIEIRRAIPDCEVILSAGSNPGAECIKEADYSGHRFVILQKPVFPAELLARVYERLTIQPSESSVAQKKLPSSDFSCLDKSSKRDKSLSAG